MQFADFGPKLALNQTRIPEEETGIIDPVYFLKFPDLNDKSQDGNHDHQTLMDSQPQGDNRDRYKGFSEERGDLGFGRSDEARVEGNTSTFVGENIEKKEPKSKRKRPRSLKTSEEVESQRMTHIAVERNRRKQMNEHLRILRTLMPSSYVQRGDQASIIGGAIEFVRELEQLLQCLESQKRRRLYGDGQPQPPLVFPTMPIPNDEVKIVEYEGGIEDEIAESKSNLADVEVKLLGFDGLIKILSIRRHGQLIKTIAALEDLQLRILHTNITTIEQTVLYSFNVKIIGGEVRFTAEDIANSVQQIFSFIHAESTI